MTFKDAFFYSLALFFGFVILYGGYSAISSEEEWEEEFHDEEVSITQRKVASRGPTKKRIRKKVIRKRKEVNELFTGKIFDEKMISTIRQNSDYIFPAMKQKERELARKVYVDMINDIPKPQLQQVNTQTTLLPDLLAIPSHLANTLTADDIVTQNGKYLYVKKESYSGTGISVVFDSISKNAFPMANSIFIKIKDFDKVDILIDEFELNVVDSNENLKTLNVTVPQDKVVQILQNLNKDSNVRKAYGNIIYSQVDHRRITAPL